MNKNLTTIIKQAQKMQEKLEQIHEQLAQREIEATSGGGMVTARVNGRQQLIALSIDPEVLEIKDWEMLQDLIVAAVNEAIRKSKEMINEEMSKLTGGIKIPGLKL